MPNPIVDSVNFQLKDRGAPPWGSVAPALSGGDAALGWSTTDRGHEGVTTITTDGTYNFGAKTQSAQRQLAYGSDVRVNTSAINTETIGGSPSLSAWGGINETVHIVDDILPDSDIDQVYLAKGVGSLVRALGFGGISAAEGITHYTSMWIRDGANLYRTYVSAYSNVSGIFNTQADWSRGERITVSKDGESDIGGYILRDDGVNGYVTIDMDLPPWGGQASLEGAIITGDVSGAVATSKTTAEGHDASSIAATKICRIYQEANITQGAQSTTAVTSRISNGLIDIDYFENGSDLQVPPYDSGSSDNSGITSPSTVPEVWVHYEIELDFSGVSGRVTIKHNGVTVHERADYEVDKMSPNFGFRLDNIGMDTPGVSMPLDAVGGSVRYGKLYSDSDLLRVYIADASTLALSTEYTPLPIRAWSNNSIEVDNYGHLGGKYLIVSDGFNEIGSVAI